MLLYLSPSSNPTIGKLQRKLRKPLHVAAQIGGAVVFMCVSQGVQAVACSPIWPDYNFVEGLFLHLLLPLLYPSLAALTLTWAVPNNYVCNLSHTYTDDVQRCLPWV